MRPTTSICLFLMVFAGCRGSKYLTNNLVQGSIPTDITSPKYVLLVQTNDHIRPSMLNNAMKKNYPAAYEVVSEKQLASDKRFADVDKYRYEVVCRYGSGGGYTSNTGTGYSTAVYSDQFVIDRKENKQFPATNLLSNNYAMGMVLFCRAIKHMQ